MIKRYKFKINKKKTCVQTCFLYFTFLQNNFNYRTYESTTTNTFATAANISITTANTYITTAANAVSTTSATTSTTNAAYAASAEIATADTSRYEPILPVVTVLNYIFFIKMNRTINTQNILK